MAGVLSKVGRRITSEEGEPYTEAARDEPQGSGQLARKNAEDMMRVSPSAYDWMNRNMPEGKRIGVAPTAAERDADDKLRGKGKYASATPDSPATAATPAAKSRTSNSPLSTLVNGDRTEDAGFVDHEKDINTLYGRKYREYQKELLDGGASAWGARTEAKQRLKDENFVTNLRNEQKTARSGGAAVGYDVDDVSRFRDRNVLSVQGDDGSYSVRDPNTYSSGQMTRSGSTQLSGQQSRAKKKTAVGNTFAGVPASAPSAATPSTPSTAVNTGSSRSPRGAGPERSSETTDSLKPVGSRQTGSVNKRRRFKAGGEDPLAVGGTLG